MTSQQNGGLKPSRRTLVKGAAWSVPVVAVANVAPAMAASPGCTETGLCFGGSTINKCCNAGTRYYWADITFTNTSNVDTVVDFSFTLSPSANNDFFFEGGGDVLANESRTFRVQSDGDAGNCSNATYPAFTITFVDSGGNEGQALVPGGSTGGSVCPDGTSGAATVEETLVEKPPADASETEALPSVDATLEEQATPAPARETITPIEPSTDAGTTDEASQTAEP